MSIAHKLVLYAALLFVGISLIVPGLLEIIKTQAGIPGLIPETAAAKNQFRALHGMMLGLGLLAIWACMDLVNAKNLVMAIGLVLLLVALARIYSFWNDGSPGVAAWLYAALELLLAGLFMLWPPGS